jgi:hypothetical protein
MGNLSHECKRVMDEGADWLHMGAYEVESLPSCRQLTSRSSLPSVAFDQMCVVLSLALSSQLPYASFISANGQSRIVPLRSWTALSSRASASVCPLSACRLVAHLRVEAPAR